MASVLNDELDGIACGDWHSKPRTDRIDLKRRVVTKENDALPEGNRDPMAVSDARNRHQPIEKDGNFERAVPGCIPNAERFGAGDRAPVVVNAEIQGTEC